MNKLKTFTIGLILIASFMAMGMNQVYPAASEFDFKKGDLSGAIMADLSNINYTDLGISASSNFNKVSTNFEGDLTFIQESFTIDRIVVRAAFSIEAAIHLMDAHDSIFEEMTGVEVFTSVPGSYFSSATLVEYENFFGRDSDSGSYRLNGLAYAGDGDGDIGSNGTLKEHSYRSEINYDHFETADFAALNDSEIENINTQYTDLTDDLLETPEEEDEYKESADDIVVSGFDNLEATILLVMSKRIAQIINKPSNQIRIDNYTLTDSWHEQIMSTSLADTIKEAYDEGKSAGFLSNFRAKSPLKFSKLGVGQKWDAFKDLSQGARRVSGRTFSAIRGSTAVTSALAFKDTIVKGTVSTFTGIKEKVRTGFSKITDGFASIKTGTQKLLAKPLAWFNGLSSKLKGAIKIIAVVLILVLAIYILLKVKMMQAIRQRA